MNQVSVLNDKKFKSDIGFQAVNSQFLTLDVGESQRNNRILNEVVNYTYIRLMKEDEVFADLFQRIDYSGSYYKGTRHGQPDEFDLDFVFKLPMDYSDVKIETEHSYYGDVKINLDSVKFYKHSDVLSSWLTPDRYLNQDKFRSWFESVFARAHNKLPPYHPMWQRIVYHTVRMRKNGPAFTLKIKCREENTEWEINVDLVPCLEFEHPLGKDYRNLDNNKNNWSAIPQPHSNRPNGHIYWRISFYNQEKDLLDRHGHLKDVIKMMKKFRDNKNLDAISSYCIENIYYLELFAQNNSSMNILKASKTALFTLGLKKLEQAFLKGEIIYFWHPQFNFLDGLDEDTIKNYFNVVKKSVLTIDNEIENNPFALANLVLTPNELTNLNLN